MSHLPVINVDWIPYEPSFNLSCLDNSASTKTDKASDGDISAILVEPSNAFLDLLAHVGLEAVISLRTSEAPGFSPDDQKLIWAAYVSKSDGPSCKSFVFCF